MLDLQFVMKCGLILKSLTKKFFQHHFGVEIISVCVCLCVCVCVCLCVCLKEGESNNPVNNDACVDGVVVVELSLRVKREIVS